MAKVCRRLRSVHRILISGTPIQNALHELWTLFDFVYPGRLGGTLAAFENEFALPIRAGGYANASQGQVTPVRCDSLRNDYSSTTESWFGLSVPMRGFSCICCYLGDARGNHSSMLDCMMRPALNRPPTGDAGAAAVGLSAAPRGAVSAASPQAGRDARRSGGRRRKWW